jgi:glycosyltransferase involved in cell wall biosynthesis
MKPVDIIVPVYNEDLTVVRQTVVALRQAFSDHPGATVFVVDDGSDERHGLSRLETEPGVRLLRHGTNRGYGQALKTGILSGSAPWIAIADADGTYPVAELPDLVRMMDGCDMVVGARTGEIKQVPLPRRFPKTMLNLAASYMAGVRIRDLNSGMRVFSRALCYYLWPFFPPRFSFTSTLSMGAHMGGFRVRERSINYYKRSGRSAIRPFRDTYRFFRLVGRLGLLFHPMKLFGPVALALLVLGGIKGFLIDFPSQQYIGNFSLLAMIAGLQIFMLGLLGKLIVYSRLIGGIHPEIGVSEASNRLGTSRGEGSVPGAHGDRPDVSEAGRPLAGHSGSPRG